MIILVILFSQGNLLQLLSANPGSDTLKYQKSISLPSELHSDGCVVKGGVSNSLSIARGRQSDVFLFDPIVNVFLKVELGKTMLLILLRQEW